MDKKGYNVVPRKAAFITGKIIFLSFTKRAILMRRATVPSIPIQ